MCFANGNLGTRVVCGTTTIHMRVFERPHVLHTPTLHRGVPLSAGVVKAELYGLPVQRGKGKNVYHLFPRCVLHKSAQNLVPITKDQANRYYKGACIACYKCKMDTRCVKNYDRNVQLAEVMANIRNMKRDLGFTPPKSRRRAPAALTRTQSQVRDRTRAAISTHAIRTSPSTRHESLWGGGTHHRTPTHARSKSRTRSRSSSYSRSRR